MPDTDLMDRTLALITAVPELHDQCYLSTPVDFPAQERARKKLAQQGESPGAFDSAHCFAGWALILAGYRCVSKGPLKGFFTRDGQGERVNEIAEAARVLGINEAEAMDYYRRRGLFWGDNTLPQIRIWVAYYHGEIDETERDHYLEEESGHA